MPTISTDSFSFNDYIKPQTDDYRLARPSSLQPDVEDLFFGKGKDEGALLPWPKTHTLFRMRPGEVTLWVGINGHGKSQVTGYVELDVMWQGQRAGLMSFEMLPKRSLWRTCRQACATNEPTKAQIGRFLRWADKFLYIFDHQGTVTANLVIGVIRYGSTVHGIKHWFIDSLMKCSRGEDDYNGQKEFVDQLCAAARDLGIHIHLIHHVRKTENEFAVPGKFDAKGSGAITDQVDNCIVVWRNKRKEAALRQNPADLKAVLEPDCILRIDKQRNGEAEADIGLWFDAPSMAYVESRGQAPRRYEPEPEDVLEAA